MLVKSLFPPLPSPISTENQNASFIRAARLMVHYLMYPAKLYSTPPCIEQVEAYTQASDIR